MSLRSDPAGQSVVSDATPIDPDERALTDTRRPVRAGFWVLGVGFLGFVAWAAFAPLDEGVPAPATVVVDTRRHVIQHLSGGVVRSVAAREGQVVKRGDLLLELDNGIAQANFETVRQSYMALRAAESRLLAEQADQPSITFHADLLAGAADPHVQQHMATQTALFTARRRALQADLAAAQEQIAGLQAQVAGAAKRMTSRQLQAQLQAEQLQSLRGLAAEGYATRNQVLSLAQSQAELTALMAELDASRQRDEHALAEVRQRIAQRRQEFYRESSAQLADVRREVQAGQDRFKAAGDDLARIQIKAPVDGQLVGLGVSTVGGVVTPGQRLMEIVPAQAALLLDVKISPQVIDRVRAGAMLDVRFSGFANSPQLVVQARLQSVSGDAITEQQGNGVTSYYLGRAEVTPEGLLALGHRAMQPGMQAEVLIKGGERSLLTYLLHPLTKRLASSMKEE